MHRLRLACILAFAGAGASLLFADEVKAAEQPTVVATTQTWMDALWELPVLHVFAALFHPRLEPFAGDTAAGSPLTAEAMPDVEPCSFAALEPIEAGIRSGSVS
jgi:hypothetical protein